MTDQNDDSKLSVRTVDSKGVAPKRRVATPAAAVGAYESARQLELTRDARFGDLRGIYDGFPPTPTWRMEEMGMADMPNFNLKQFQYKVDRYVETWRRVTTAGEMWYEVTAKHPDPREALRRSKYLTDCFNRAIRRWDSTDYRRSNGYVLRCAARDTQLGLFGIGVSHFTDSIDWRWETRPTRKVLVPKGAQITLENCPIVFVDDYNLSVPQLYAMRKKAGWNEAAVLWALYMRTNETQKNSGRAFTYAEWENEIRNNEAFFSTREFAPCRLVHCYVREFGDDANVFDITHTIFIETITTGSTDDKDKPQPGDEKLGWLYEKTKAAKRWSEIFAVFADNAGPEMEWHGVKGHGDLIYDTCHFNNQMFNRTATSAIIANMPIFTGSDEFQRQKLNQVVFSYGAILYPDIGTLTQLKIGGDIGGAASMFELGTRSLDTISRTPPANQQMGPEKTATQENYERMEQTELSSLQIGNYFATGGDPLGGEMYRRLAQPASKYPKAHPGGHVAELFRKEAAEFGIPEDELLNVETVMATRKGGSGSMGVDILKAKEAMAIATPGAGQLFARRLIASSMFPETLVDALVEEKAPPPDQEDVVIALENLNMQNGQVPQAFGFQPHEKHLKQPSNNDHLSILSGIEQVVNAMLKTGIEPNQIQDAIKLHNSFDAGIIHCEQHVEFMRELPRMGARPSIYEGFIREINPVLNGMKQISRSFAETIASAQEMAAQQPENMDAEMLETQAEIQRKDMLAQAEIARKDAAADAKLGNLAVTHQARTDTKLSDHELKQGLEAQKSAFDLQKQRTQAIQELEEKAGQAQVDIALEAAKGEQKIQTQRQVDAAKVAAAKKKPKASK